MSGDAGTDRMNRLLTAHFPCSPLHSHMGAVGLFRKMSLAEKAFGMRLVANLLVFGTGAVAGLPFKATTGFTCTFGGGGLGKVFATTIFIVAFGAGFALRTGFALRAGFTAGLLLGGTAFLGFTGGLGGFAAAV